MQFDAEAGEHFGLPVVGQVADKAVVQHFGDERGGGDAAVLEAGRQRGDDGFCERVADPDILGADGADATEAAALIVELFADFLANATPGGGIGEDFGGFEDFFLGDGQVFGEARGAGLLAGELVVGGDFSRRSGVCGNGGGSFFCAVGVEQKQELGGIERFAFGTEDAADEGVDGLFKKDDLGGLAGNDI